MGNCHSENRRKNRIRIYCWAPLQFHLRFTFMNLMANELASSLFSFSYFQIHVYKHRVVVFQNVVQPDKYKWERGNEVDGLHKHALDFCHCRDQSPRTEQLKTTDMLSHSSAVQKSDLGLTGLKSKCQKSCIFFFSVDFRGQTTPLDFPIF